MFRLKALWLIESETTFKVLVKNKTVELTCCATLCKTIAEDEASCVTRAVEIWDTFVLKKTFEVTDLCTLCKTPVKDKRFGLAEYGTL